MPKTRRGYNEKYAACKQAKENHDLVSSSDALYPAVENEQIPANAVPLAPQEDQVDGQFLAADSNLEELPGAVAVPGPGYDTLRDSETTVQVSVNRTGSSNHEIVPNERIISAVLVPDDEERGTPQTQQDIQYVEAKAIPWYGNNNRIVLFVGILFLISGVVAIVVAVTVSRGGDDSPSESQLQGTTTNTTPSPTPEPTGRYEHTLRPSFTRITAAPSTPPTVVPTSTPILFSELGDAIQGFETNDNLGTSVALSSNGTVLAIGAVENYGDGTGAGHVEVYELSPSGDVWSQMGENINGRAGGDQFGRSVALSSDGMVLAVGAPYSDGGGQSDAGSVRVFAFENNEWSQVGDDIYGEAAGGESGWSVSLSDDGQIVAIGAPRNDDDTGQVRVYRNLNGAWEKLGENIDGKAYQYGQAGWSVSLSNDGMAVAIGANQNEEPFDHTGQVRVFRFINDDWDQLGQDLNGENRLDQMGSSVSLSGNGLIVAMGAIGYSDNAGHVQVYQYNGTSWSQLGQDIVGEAAGDQSGVSVSLSKDGRTVAIGAHRNSGALNGAGHVRVYQFSNDTWTQVAEDIDGQAAGDRFGAAVSLASDMTVAVGAPLYSGGFRTDFEGIVRVYHLYD